MSCRMYPFLAVVDAAAGDPLDLPPRRRNTAQTKCMGAVMTPILAKQVAAFDANYRLFNACHHQAAKW